MHSLSSHNRPALLRSLQTETFDLLVIGGGITGAGIALDAASRGLKVGLVEMIDFASGTSSRSTKLIHGGLRYLKQFEIGLVRETGRERAVVHRLAPHLAAPEKMLLPLIEGGQFGSILTSIGLMVYDVLAGVDKPDQRLMLDKEETLAEEPMLDPSNLKGGGLYAEYRTDDARLTMEVIKTAVNHGALCANYTKATGFVYDEQNMISAVTCEDMLSGESFDVTAKHIVSAAGPWVDTLRKKDNSLEGKRLHLTKGVHIVVPHTRFPVKHSVYFDTPDGRMIFAVPRNRITYIGTTDTDYTGDKVRIRTNQEDVDYLLHAVNEAFPKLDLKASDANSSWAGLRPLIHEDGKSASELSRKDEIFESERGLISIAGGKLTGYRKMAERLVDLVAKRVQHEDGRRLPDCKTSNITLNGGDFADYEAVNSSVAALEARLKAIGLGHYDAYYLVHNYGTFANTVMDMVVVKEGEDSQFSLMKAELAFCLQHESVHRPLDFLNRRTGRLYFHIESVIDHGEAILALFSAYFSWTNEQMEAERNILHEAITDAQEFPKNLKSKA
ncbi:MAG: glycerol-3-phosphate dehydrogenase/oxidase [Bacteroidia bacterium]